MPDMSDQAGLAIGEKIIPAYSIHDPLYRPAGCDHLVDCKLYTCTKMGMEPTRALKGKL